MTVVNALGQQLVAMPPSVQLIGAIWIAAMIAVPLLRWTFGVGAERIGISIGVATQALFVAALLVHALPMVAGIAIVIAIPVLGWLFEFVGSRTGIPFGHYEYTSVLLPQIGRVPLVVPLAWLMMIPPAASVGHLLLPSGPLLLRLAVSAAAFTAWDLYLDPQMVMWDFWRWRDHGGYFGIPARNFAGWFVCGFIALAVVSLVLPSSACYMPVWPLFGVYVLTWMFEAVAQLVFWGLYGPGAVGFAGMGAFVVWVFLSVAQ